MDTGKRTMNIEGLTMDKMDKIYQTIDKMNTEYQTTDQPIDKMDQTMDKMNKMDQTMDKMNKMNKMDQTMYIEELTGINTANVIFKEQLGEKTIKNRKGDIVSVTPPIPKFTTSIQINVVLNGGLDLSILKNEGYERVKEIRFKDAGTPSTGGLTEIFNIPETVEILKCQGNRLKTISSLPTGLKELDIERNEMTDIDFTRIPNLKKLNISNNQFQELKNLPAGLKYLNCSYNEIRYLDLEGTNELTHLYINNNKIVSILNIPSSLKHVSYYNNPLKEISIFDTIPGLAIYDDRGVVNQRQNTTKDLVNDEEVINGNEIDDSDSGITDSINYKEAITQYFKMKRDYEAGLKSKISKIKNKTKDDKKKRRFFVSSVKGNCIVCKRSVGTIFKKKNNYYIAICGDVGRNPCRLNIRIFNGVSYNFFDDMHYFKEYTEKGMEEIIKQKMDVLFNYLSDKKATILFEGALKKYTDYNDGFAILYDEYKKIYENPAKTELLRLKNERIYSILEEINERLEEYKKNPTNNDLLREVIELQQKDLVPAVVALRNAKYETMMVTCDLVEKEGGEGVTVAPKCSLIQSEYNIDNFIYLVEEPKVIRFDV